MYDSCIFILTICKAQNTICYIDHDFFFDLCRHVPKAKATIVADTPEMKRLASNTKIQSNVQYHAEFEANKAKFTSVTDDPESKRLAANSKVQSNISYHGLVEQKEQQEKKRSVIDEGPPSVPNVGEFIHHHPYQHIRSKFQFLFKKSILTHCSKSSFFVQKFNFDFTRKLSIFLSEKLMKMLWFWTF